MSIESAYELAVMGKRPEGAPAGIYEGLSGEEQAAAVRAAMMAVLDRAALLGGDHGVELTEEYQALRREIEELGK